MKITQQTVSTLFLLVVFLSAVSVLYADTEKILIEDESAANPKMIEKSDRKIYDESGMKLEPEGAAVVERTVEESGNTRTTITTIRETEEITSSERAAELTGGKYDPVDDIEVDVQMDDSIYQTNQNVNGEIIVRNNAPESLPATFFVKVYHDNQLYRHLKVQTEDKLIPPGISRYSLDEFGIPDLNKNPNYGGEWTIMVYQDQAGAAEEEDFRVERIDI